VKNNVRVGVGAFVIKDGKFLMQKRIGAHGANTWAPPGGGMEFGESWEQTTVREVREETGLIVDNV
jgi:8-oxo-dGTP diphosphatase